MGLPDEYERDAADYAAVAENAPTLGATHHAATPAQAPDEIARGIHAGLFIGGHWYGWHDTTEKRRMKAVDTVLAANKQARLTGAHATVGRVRVAPNATNAIPASVTAWLDARAADEPTLAKLVNELTAKATERARRDGTAITVSAESTSAEMEFSAALIGLLVLSYARARGVAWALAAAAWFWGAFELLDGLPLPLMVVAAALLVLAALAAAPLGP